jgi:hypothetical protein
VAATVRTGSGATTVAAIGEAKHTVKPRTIADLDRLARSPTLLIERGQAQLSTKLLIFSAAGFDRRLLAAGDDRDDVELVDLDRMYRGA